MLQVIKKLLTKVIEDIDAGNSNITESQGVLIIQYLSDIANGGKKYNRTQAAKYLHCSVLSFDIYRKEGKIPNGIKEVGGVILWTLGQLDAFVKKYKQ